MTHICVGKLTITGSDNGLSPGRRQAIIWTNAGILLIEPLRTNFNESLIGTQTFSFKKMHLKCRLPNGVHVVSASMCFEARGTVFWGTRYPPPPPLAMVSRCLNRLTLPQLPPNPTQQFPRFRWLTNYCIMQTDDYGVGLLQGHRFSA